jgi:ABC-type branched-subunit amino acid transport system substrate-binding protein
VNLGILTSKFPARWTWAQGGYVTNYSFIDPTQQYLAAYLMAVDKINKDSNILPLTNIQVSHRDTQSDSQYALHGALELAKDAFDGRGVDAILGPYFNQETELSARALQQFDVLNLSPTASSLALSKKSDYPYFARLAPSVYFEALAMVDLLRHYNWYEK